MEPTPNSRAQSIHGTIWRITASTAGAGKILIPRTRIVGSCQIEVCSLFLDLDDFEWKSHLVGIRKLLSVKRFRIHLEVCKRHQYGR